jgi:hypothetical protein
MGDDPLAEFRKGGATPQATTPKPAEEPQERETYRALAGKDNQRKARLDIRRKDGMAHAVGYNFIVEICYDRKGYTGILLVLTTMLVKIKGTGLRPMVDALKLGTCEFIQEFNPDEFDRPDDGGPFVESIEVISSAEQRVPGKKV